MDLESAPSLSLESQQVKQKGVGKTPEVVFTEIKSSALCLKMIYGLRDRGDYWHATMKNHLKKELKLIPMTGDLASFIQVCHKQPRDMIGIHVTDSIGTGDTNFID